MKKRVGSNLSKKLILCVSLLLIFSMFNLYLLLYLFPEIEVTGSAITASVGFTILESDYIIIGSPLNITYNFSILDPYTIDLNVSAVGFTANKWWYTLWDLKHDELVNDSVEFTPNTTFNAVRWQNRLQISANKSSNGENKTQNVTFFVYVPNSAPILADINSSIYVCEGESLDYDFNATDVDEDSITIDIFPKNPFYVSPTSFDGEIYMNSSIISGVLDKDDVGGIDNGFKVYEETVSISDGEYVDTDDTNITVIEINNEPVMETIGVQTIWTAGDNSTFDKQVQVTDVEDGDQDAGNLNFNISFSGDELFNISSNGIMNFTPNLTHIGVHNITVCVNDTALASPYENISSVCGQDGSSITVCDSFSLTVTDENRAPSIIDYYPDDLSLNVSGTDNLYFNISEYDPDGTFPDAYWYVGGILQDYDSGSLIDEFNYSFGCGLSGEYITKAEITDGLLNDSLEWTLNVTYVACPAVLPPEGVGGGFRFCVPLWVCGGWGICQNTEKSLESGLLSGEDYRNISRNCEENNLDETTCGIQIKECLDINNCGTDLNKPVEIQFCHYTERPGCYDRIKNCHDGYCELLVDCGGPCAPCPTCSDGIRNQGEGRVDCGGPCPWKCKIEKPLLRRTWLLYALLIIAFLLLLIAIIKLIRIFKVKKLSASK